MKKRFHKLDLDLYEETLNNGLSVYIVPMKNVNNMAHMKALFGKYNTGHPLCDGL